MSYKSCVLPGLIAIRWGEIPEPADVAAYAAEIVRARQRETEPIVALFVMPPDSGAPPEDFRKVQAAQLPTIMANLEFAVAVFEGTGFRASLKRSALVGILLLSPKRYPIYVRSSVEDALLRDPPKPIRFNGYKAIQELRSNGIVGPAPASFAPPPP